MKKNILILLFIVVFSFSLAENFGADLFSDDVDAYFSSKDVNIYDLQNSDLNDMKEVLEEYKLFKGINISEYLQNREYSIAYEKVGFQKRFLILISLDGESVKLPDDGFETEEMNGLTIKYTIGEDQYIFAYDENQLIFSNDMTLFFLTIESNVKEKKVLSEKDKFAKLMNEDFQSVYKYYVENEKLIDDEYISLATSYYELNSGGYIRKNYLLDGSEREYKNFDMTDYIPQNYSQIKLGLIPEIIKSGIVDTIPEFKLFDENKIDMYLSGNMELAAEVKLENQESYILVTLGDYLSTEKFIKQIFEEALFYNRELTLVDATGYKYFEIPLLFRKIYFVEAGRFLLFTDNFEIVNSYINGEIYNENFVDTMNYDEAIINEDKLIINSNAENVMLNIENFIR